MSFAHKLKKLREKSGLTQRELAKKLNIGTGTVGMWESTDRMPPSKTLQSVAQFFNVSVDYLLSDSIYTAEDYPVGMHSVTVNDRELQLLENYRLLSENLQDFTFDTVERLTKVN